MSATWHSHAPDKPSPDTPPPTPHGVPPKDVHVASFGAPGSLNFRSVFLSQNDKTILSPWHDICLYLNPPGLLSFVCKTPAGSWVRYEISSDEPFNPLRVVKVKEKDKKVNHPKVNRGQSQPYLTNSGNSGNFGWTRSKSSAAHKRRNSTEGAISLPDGKLLSLPSDLHPGHYGQNSPWNVGILPQTWVANGRAPRGNSPLEVIDIGTNRIRKPGEVYLVKPLGAWSVERGGDGMLTWIVVGIAADDPLTRGIADVADVRHVLPGLLRLVRDWLRVMITVGRECEKDNRCHVSRNPVRLSVTLSKIAEFHEAWRHFPGRHAINSELVPLPKKSCLNSTNLKKMWIPYIAVHSDPDTKPGSIPISCPSLDSSLSFDPSWVIENSNVRECFKECSNHEFNNCECPNSESSNYRYPYCDYGVFRISRRKRIVKSLKKAKQIFGRIFSSYGSDFIEVEGKFDPSKVVELMSEAENAKRNLDAESARTENTIIRSNSAFFGQDDSSVADSDEITTKSSIRLNSKSSNFNSSSGEFSPKETNESGSQDKTGPVSSCNVTVAKDKKTASDKKRPPKKQSLNLGEKPLEITETVDRRKWHKLEFCSDSEEEDDGELSTFRRSISLQDFRDVVEEI